MQIKKIRTKLLMSFLVIVLFMVLLSGYSYFILSQSNENAEKVADEQLPLLIAEENLNIIVSNLIATARGYLLSEGDYADRFYMHVEEFEEFSSEALALTTGEGQQELQALVQTNREWIQDIDQNVLGVYDAGDPDQALENFETMNGTARELIEGYSALVNEREQLITEMEDQIVAEGETAITIQVIAVVITLVISVVLAFIISNRISKPINLIKDQMRKVGDGKLNLKPLKVESKDEIGQMAAETNHMQHRLQEIITNISQATEEMTSHSEELMQSSSEVQSVSEQVSATMQELASGSESQANHAGEIATAMDNFIQKVEVSNENGEKIQQSSTEVVDMAEKGHELMQSSEQQMKSIDSIVQESVEKVEALDVQYQNISKFVSVIQEIAEQTNLLSLNAAIEAARAGEQGKGFAVVANEVKKLAEQSSESVSEIIDLVNTIQKESEEVTNSLQTGFEQVQKGTSQINETSETFGRIRLQISQMDDHIEQMKTELEEIAGNGQEMSNSVQEIASLSEESSAGIEETSASMEETNSSMQEVSASSEQLAGLAEQLKERVSRFKL
jgi:methyl-accepting chemotaxis protein